MMASTYIFVLSMCSFSALEALDLTGAHGSMSAVHRLSRGMSNRVGVSQTSHPKALDLWGKGVQALVPQKAQERFVISFQLKVLTNENVSESLTCPCQPQSLFFHMS